MSPDRWKRIEGLLLLIACVAGLISAVVRPEWDARILPVVLLVIGLALIAVSALGMAATWGTLPGALIAGLGLQGLLSASGLEIGRTGGSWLLPVLLILGLFLLFWFGFNQRWALAAAGALLAFLAMQGIRSASIHPVSVFLAIMAIVLIAMCFVLSPRRFWLLVPALTCITLAVLYSIGIYSLLIYVFFAGLVLSGLVLIAESFNPQKPGGLIHGR